MKLRKVYTHPESKFTMNTNYTYTFTINPLLPNLYSKRRADLYQTFLNYAACYFTYPKMSKLRKYVLGNLNPRSVI